MTALSRSLCAPPAGAPADAPLDSPQETSREAEPHLVADAARVRRALEIVLKTLARLPENPKTRHLVAQAERLLTEIDLWRDSRPTAETRDRAMRTTLSIHLAALRATAETARW